MDVAPNIQMLLVLVHLYFISNVLSADISEDLFICKRKEGGDGHSHGNHKAAGRLEHRMDNVERALLKFQQSVTSENGHVRSVPRGCSEIARTGMLLQPGVFEVSPDGRCPFYVFCDVDGWTVIQRRTHGNVSFERSWEEYVSGFGNLTGDFWLGLEKVHRLTSGGSRLMITMNKSDSNTGYLWGSYEAVEVHSVMKQYALNVDPWGYVGNVPELLSYHNGMKFTTHDRDLDKMIVENCSQKYGRSGWWFNACFRLGNLNGRFGVREAGGMSYWDNQDVYISGSEMKVKPSKGEC
ncbi:fibrinogen-like protein A [Mya arenaria]|uniref:fibrinogen-like protein A n=1 Tax=Mya arenaria TaxID=6604 RepID=UPI0022E3137D|nr:fibrinogen-like protein A [Mya arenaria]